ncbi:UNVERIFIED_CONTAM: hypothetical protein FKN15_030564 [Acipenser sinensis]
MMVFTSHGPTVIMPSWYCARDWFDQVGRFKEGGKGVPEDLLLFYESLRKGGGVSHVDEGLLMYRYHSRAATHSVLDFREDSWLIFLDMWFYLPRDIFFSCGCGHHLVPPSPVPGREGPEPLGFLHGLECWETGVEANQKKVVAFCDVNENKINKRLLHARGVKVRPIQELLNMLKTADPDSFTIINQPLKTAELVDSLIVKILQS